jgi:charged multivesicular body protein 1
VRCSRAQETLLFFERPPLLDTTTRCAPQENQLFQMKFTSKQLSRMQTKCEKQERDEKLKVKKAIEKGDAETARIYAQNAIRIKNNGNNYLRLASRLDAVASRVESAIKMKAVTKQMGGVVKGMDKVLASMDVNKISSVMDKFEASFDELDTRSQYIEGAMNSSTASTMPEDAVDKLLSQVSDEHGLQFKASAADASTTPVQMALPTAALEESQEDALEKRLQALRQ